MRNLKRALSLTLASVMLLGMMVVGSSAASYPDVDENDNVEAIEVLRAVQVMRGDDNGNFDPDRSVTRAEMAVVMALLLDLDYQYYEATCPFTDVAAWARPYVGACYANGIVSGYSATTYGSNDGVTPVQAASMMMRALGYFRYASDYKDGFETATVRQGTRIGIFTDVGSSASAAMTRNQVAQMALNALQCTMVDAEQSIPNISLGSGDTAVNIEGQVNYVVRTSATNDRMTTAIKSNTNTGTGTDGTTGQTIELGEQLYSGDLVKRADTDAFGAPAVRWSYRNNEIGKYADEADLTYISEVKIKDIYKDLGLSQSPTSTTYKEDGVNKTTANDGTTTLDTLTDRTSDGEIGDAKIGAKGSVTNVYYTENGNQRTATVVITNYYLAKAEGDYDAGDKEVDLTVYSADNSSLTVKDEDVPVSNVKKDDYLVVTIADGEVMTAVPADVVADVEVSSARDKDYVVAGQRYEYNGVSKESGEALGDEYITDSDEYSLNDSTYNLYLDPHGYVLGVEAVEENANVGDYLIITADPTTVGYDVVARAMFTDGTEETITISKVGGSDAEEDDVSNHKFYTFRQRSNGKYELTEVQTSQTDTRKAYSPTNNGTGVDGGVDNKARPITGVSCAGTNSTVFIADGKVFTGARNAPKVDSTSAGIFYVLDKDGRLLIVWTAEKGKVQTSSDDLVYILDEDVAAVRRDGREGDTYYLYKAFYQGEKVEDFAVNSRDIEDRGLYEIDSYSDDRADLSRDGLVSKKAASDDTYEYVKGITSIRGTDSILSVGWSGGDGDYILADNAKIYTVDGDTVREVSAGNLSTDRIITRDKFDTITIVREENDEDADVIMVFLSKASESPNPEVTPGGTVENPSESDIMDAIGDGTQNPTFSGNIPEGNFTNGQGAGVPDVTLENATIAGDTTIGGGVIIKEDTLIKAGGRLEAVDVIISTGATLDQQGELAILVLRFENGGKWHMGETGTGLTATASAAIYIDFTSNTINSIPFDTNYTGLQAALMTGIANNLFTLAADTPAAP